MKPKPKYMRVVEFFEKNQDKKFNSTDVKNYLLQHHDFSKKIIRKGWTLERTVMVETSSVLSLFYSDEKQYQHLKPLRNFQREKIGNEWYYSHINYNAPIQTTLNFEEPQTNQEKTLEQSQKINSPLFEDIIAADKINDPIQQIIDIYNNINIQDLQDFNISTIRDNKKITIAISNL
jgi:hypothetical protein